MPEEINRVLTDHCSDYLFAPTENARKILLSEGVPDAKIFVTGNTIVDASKARLVLTDSGGVQEEACIQKVPCVTLRDNTERPETLEVGSNILAGTNPENILECTKLMLSNGNNWENPFGDGKAGERIIKFLITNAGYSN